jgi:hypothetical protein
VPIAIIWQFAHGHTLGEKVPRHVLAPSHTRLCRNTRAVHDESLQASPPFMLPGPRLWLPDTQRGSSPLTGARRPQVKSFLTMCLLGVDVTWLYPGVRLTRDGLLHKELGGPCP